MKDIQAYADEDADADAPGNVECQERPQVHQQQQVPVQQVWPGLHTCQKVNGRLTSNVGSPLTLPNHMWLRPAMPSPTPQPYWAKSKVPTPGRPSEDPRRASQQEQQNTISISYITIKYETEATCIEENDKTVIATKGALKSVVF